MKNKFKLFCTFMICLIFLTLVNTNSPQPSADSANTEALEGVSVEIIPASDVPLVCNNGNWLKYIGNIWYPSNTNKFSFTLYTVVRYNGSSKLTRDKIVSIQYKFNNTFTENLASVTNIESSSENKENGTTYILSTDVVDPKECFKNFDDCSYNLGNPIEVELQMKLDEAKSVTLNLKSCKTKKTVIDTENINYKEQYASIPTPIPKLDVYQDSDPNNHNTYSVFQRCYNVDSSTVDLPDYDKVASVFYDSDKPTDKSSVGNLITNHDYMYDVWNSSNSKALIVTPYEGTKSNIKDWFDPESQIYNEGYNVTKIDPFSYNDLGFHSEQSSPLFNRKLSSGDFTDGIVNFDVVNIGDFNTNTSAYIKDNGESPYSIIIFGTCDSNNDNDLSQRSAAACLKYLNNSNHHHIILGHDTAIMDRFPYENDGCSSVKRPCFDFGGTAYDNPPTLSNFGDHVSFSGLTTGITLGDGTIGDSWSTSSDDPFSNIGGVNSRGAHPYFCWLATKTGFISTFRNGNFASSFDSLGYGCYYNGLVDINNPLLSSSRHQGLPDESRNNPANNRFKMLGTYYVKTNEGDFSTPTGESYDSGFYSEIYEFSTNFNSAGLTYPNKMSYTTIDTRDGKLNTYRVPPCHTVGQNLTNNSSKCSTIYLMFSGYPITNPNNPSDRTDSKNEYDKNYSDNYYLASSDDRKIWMFQTGHSSGLASTQERQLWANLLCKLCYTEDSTQVTTDVKLVDSNSPLVKSASISSDAKSVNLKVKDQSTVNTFICNNRDVTKIDLNLNQPDSCNFSAGNKGYAYFFSNDDFGVGDLDSISSKEDQDKYTSGDFETYTFDSWKNFNSKSDQQADSLFSNSTTSKLDNSTTGSATIDLSKSNGAKYAYICLFDNSTRMAKDKSALSDLSYYDDDYLADGDNLPVLNNGSEDLDAKLKDEWSSNSNVNWDSIKKYGNRTVIRVKLGKQVASTKITNSPYFDPSEQNQFFSNKSNRNDKIAKTGNQVITTVSKVSRTADSNAEKMIAISNNSELADSIEDADAWYNVDDNEFGYKSNGIIKSAKVLKPESTGDFITYTIEWTISSSSNLTSGTEQYWYNYVYIKPSKGDSFMNGNVEHFIVDTKAPTISYETVTAGSDYKIKVQDLSNSTSTYQSGIKSVSVTLISDGDREETDCSFNRNGDKRETSVDLELKQDMKDYDKIEITSEDNVGNTTVSIISLEGVKPPKPEDSSNIAVNLKNWYYCSKDNSNKWVSGSKNPSMINTSNDAYIKIKNNNYLTLRNGLYAEEKAMYDATSSGYTPSDDPLSQVSSSKSSVTVNLKTDKGIFTPSVWEQYGKLDFGESSDLTNIKDNSNGYYKLSSEVTVNNKENSNNKDLDNMNYLNTIPIKGIKSVLNSSLSVQFYASQNIYGEVDAERTYYTYVDKVVKEAWDERDEEGNLIPGGHHDAVTEKVAVPHTKTKTFTYGKALQENSATASLNETLSVDSKKPYLNKEESNKTGRYTNHIVFNDLDDEDNSKGASGIHTIKLYLVDSIGSTDRSVNALDSSTDYSFKTGSGNSAYIDCWNGAKPKDHENNVNVSSCHELEMDIDCFAQDSTPDYLHTKVDPKKNKIYNYLYYEIEDNVGNKATGYYDLKPTTVTAQITEDGQDPNSYPEDNTPDKPKSEIPVNPIGPKNPLFNEKVSINAHPTEITDPKDNSKKRKIVDVEVNASITNPTPDFSPKLEIYGYGKNDEYRKPSDFSNLIDKSNKNEMSKFGERPLTKDTYSEIYVDDTYNTPEKPTAHVDIDSSSSLLKFKELEDPKLPYFFEVYTKTCEDEDWIKEVDTVHPLYFASGYDHDRIVIYKVDGDHSEPNDYWKKNPVLSGNYYGTGKYGDEGSVDISNLRTGWYKAELIMYDFNGNPSGKEELWFYQNQPASYTPFNVSISAVKDVDWEGDVRFNYKETKVPSVPVNDLQKDKDTKTNPNDTVDKDVEINLDSNRRPGSFVSDTGDSDYYPLGLNFGANGDSLKRIDWTNSDKTSYDKPKEGDSDKGNPIAKGYAVNWNFSKENKQQLNSLSLNYSYTTTSGDSLTIYSSDGSTKLTDDPSNGLYVDSQELTQTQLDALNSSVDNSDSLNGYLKPPSFDPNKSMYTQIPVKHYLPENFVAKTSSGSVYNGVVIVTVTFKATISQGTMASSAADQSIDLYAIYQGETALDDVTLDRQR